MHPFNKRRVRRLACQSKVTLMVGHRLFLCDLLDLSATGCRVRLEDDRSLRGQVAIAFPTVSLEVRARCVWRRGDQAGFQFLYPTREEDAEATEAVETTGPVEGFLLVEPVEATESVAA